MHKSGHEGGGEGRPEETIKKAISQLSFCLTFGPTEGIKMTMDILKKFKTDLGKIDQIEVKDSGFLEQMINVLKLCIILEDPEFKSLFNVPPEKILNYLPKHLTDFSSLTCEIIEEIITKVDKNKAYTILECLTLDTGNQNFAFEQLFKSKKGLKKPNFYFHNGMNYSKIFSIYKLAVVHCKNTLSLAESKPPHGFTNSAFTPLSAKIAQILDSMISTMTDLLSDPKSSISINPIPAFELLQVLIDACPFNRMDPTLFRSLTHFLGLRLVERPQLYDRELLLPITLSLVSQKDKTVEDLGKLAEIVQTLKTPGIYSSLVVSKSIQYLLFWKSGIEMRSTYMLERNRVVMWDVLILIQLAKNHFELFMNDAFICLRMFIESIQQTGEFERLLEAGAYSKTNRGTVDRKQLGEYMSIYKPLFTFFEQVTIQSSELIKRQNEMYEIQKYLSNFIKVWEDFLTHVPGLLQLKCDIFAPAAADALASLGEELFLYLPHESRLAYMNLVFKMTTDPRNDVKAKIGRALSNILTFSFTLWNSKSTLYCVSIIEENLESKNANIRSTYAWAIGNLADSMGRYCKHEYPAFMKFKFVERLFSAAFKCSRDNKQNIRYNGHRALGLLFRWAPRPILEDPSMEDYVFEAVDLLNGAINNGNDVKSRWNASFALGCILGNSELLTEYPNILGCIIESVSLTAQESRVYKEKIQCIKNLGFLSRVFYGQDYYMVWPRVLLALEIPQDVGPKEWPLIEKLRLEGSITVAKLLICLELEDLQNLSELFCMNQVHLKKIIEYGITHLGRDEVTVIDKARERVDRMLGKAASDEEKEQCKLLKDILTFDTVIY